MSSIEYLDNINNFFNKINIPEKHKVPVYIVLNKHFFIFNNDKLCFENGNISKIEFKNLYTNPKKFRKNYLYSNIKLQKELIKLFKYMLKIKAIYFNE